MLQQIPDSVTMDSQLFHCWQTSLDGFFIERGLPTQLLPGAPRYSECVRGYQASWLIDEGLLWLTAVVRYDTQRDLLPRLFGMAGRRPVLALWFTGSLTLFPCDPNGELPALDMRIQAGRVMSTRRSNLHILHDLL